jgi:hypothetical protein
MADTPTPLRPRLGIGALVNHVDYGRGRIVRYQEQGYLIQFKNGETRWAGWQFHGLTPVAESGDAELDRIKQAVGEVLLDYGWIEADLEMGKRWLGGTLRMIPGQEGTQPKDVPLEAFFKKVIGVREKLRVLEQKINNHPSLSPEERLDLQGYISRCYGSLTTFNALFASKASYFTSGGGSAEESD